MVVHTVKIKADTEGRQYIESKVMPIVHSRHWQMARYELPIEEVERKVGNRYVVDVIVADHEDLAYVHKWTGKRVEFSRPRVDNMAAYLDEATAKWECELAIAEANKREKPSCIVGHIDLSTVKSCNWHVTQWNKKAAANPDWVKYPTKMGPRTTAGAFGKAGSPK